MYNDSPPTVTTARPPFDDANADVILHTSDHVDFRVFRLILSLSSPFFQDMFSLPQPTDAPSCTPNNPNGTPHPPSIDVSEDSQTLDTLLRFLYPNTHVTSFRDLVHAHNVALAASKYDMSVALDKIADKIEVQYVAVYPLHVYLIACRMGWETVARAAAMHCLDSNRMPGEVLDGDNVLQFPGAGVAYHRLETYRKACGRALAKQLDNAGIFTEEDSCDSDGEGDVHGGISGQCLNRWTSRYLANIQIALTKCPRADALDSSDLVPLADCSRCYIEKAHAIATTRSRVLDELEAALSEVELRFHS